MTKTIIVVIMLLLSSANLQAAPNKALEGLEVLRRGFADVSDFTAEIVQEKQISLLKRTQVVRGVIRFRKPGLFFMELYPPHASRLLLNNNVFDIYLVREKISQHVVLPPEESLQYWFSLLARPVVRLPEGVDVRAEQHGNSYTLSMIPRAKGQVKEFTLTFLADGRLKKLVISEQNNDRTTITFSRMRKNAGLIDKDFTLQ